MDKQTKINTIQKELDKGKEPILLDDDTIQYIKKPLGKAHYKNGIDHKEDLNIYRGSDYVECDICDKKYTKYNKSKHLATKHHQFCVKLNKKWRKMLIDD